MLRTLGREPKNFGIKLAGFLHVDHVDGNVINADDARPFQWLACPGGKRSGLQNHTKHHTCEKTKSSRF